MNALARPNYASSWIFTPTDEEVKERIERLAIARAIPPNWLHDVAHAIARLDGRDRATSRDLGEAVHYWPPDEWHKLAAGAHEAGRRARRVLEEYQRRHQLTLFNPATETPWGKPYAVRDGRAVVIRHPRTFHGRREWEVILTGLEPPQGWLDPDFALRETTAGSNLYQLWLEFYSGDPHDLAAKKVPVTPPLPLREAKKHAAEWLLEKLRAWSDYEQLKRNVLGYLRARNPLPEVTDRALRYRARNAIEQDERRCIYCGSPSGWIEVEHISGREEDNSPDNLAWACRACNTQKGAVFARAGIGRRTRQLNPRRRRRRTSVTKGASTLAEWMDAVMALKGQPSRLTLEQAIEKVRATPAWDRSAFAAEIWERRRARGTDRPVPF